MKIEQEEKTWGHKRLEELLSGPSSVPGVVTTLKLGYLNEWSPGFVKKRWSPKPEVLNSDGSMFGGMTAALADQILTFATLTVCPNDKAFRTVNLSLQFFRVSHNQPLTIEARVVAQSKRLVSVEADFAHDDGALVAKATAQQVILPFPKNQVADG